MFVLSKAMFPCDNALIPFSGRCAGFPNASFFSMAKVLNCLDKVNSFRQQAIPFAKLLCLSGIKGRIYKEGTEGASSIKRWMFLNHLYVLLQAKIYNSLINPTQFSNHDLSRYITEYYRLVVGG